MGVPGFERSHHLHRRLCFFTLRGLFSFTHYEGRGGSPAPPTAVVSLHFHGRSTLFFHPRWLPLASHTPNPPALSLPPLFPLSSRPPPVPHPPLTRPLPAPYPPPTRPPPAPHLLRVASVEVGLLLHVVVHHHEPARHALVALHPPGGGGGVRRGGGRDPGGAG